MVTVYNTPTTTTGRGILHPEDRHQGDSHSHATGPAHAHLAWSAVVAGSLTAIALLVLASSLGYAMNVPGYRGTGFNAGTAIYAILVSTLAFFAGGLISTYLTPRAEQRTGILHGMLAWVLGVILMMALSGAGFGLFRGMVVSDLRLSAVTGALTHDQVVGAAWTVFLSLFFGMIASAIGGVIGFAKTLRTSHHA